MRSLQKHARGAVLLAVTLACLSFGSGAARADSVTYAFTGIGLFSGTDFSYTSPSGFVSSPTGVLTVNPGGVVVEASEFSGSASLASFMISTDTSLPTLEVLTFSYNGMASGAPANIPISPLDLSSYGTEMVYSPSPQIDGNFLTLTIAPTAAAEPSSLALLLSGMLGLCFLAGAFKAFGPAQQGD